MYKKSKRLKPQKLTSNHCSLRRLLTIMRLEDAVVSMFDINSWRSPSSDPQKIPPAQPVMIAVMGATGSGKTTFINLISGSSLRVGTGLHSCTADIQVSQTFELERRSVMLIDTPGFDDTSKSDTDILGTIASFLGTAYEKNTKLAGVIYIQRISDNRMGGISTRNFRMFRKLCGDDTLKNVILMTNMWGEVSEEVGATREAQLSQDDMFFAPALRNGARLLRHYNTLESAENILKCVISNHPEALQIQRELVEEKKAMSETAAGGILNEEFRQLARKHEEDMKKLEEEMKEVIEERDLKAEEELTEARKKLQAEMRRIEENSEKLASDYSAERAKFERQFQEQMEAARQEASDNQRKIENLESHLEGSVSAGEVKALRSELEELRNRRHDGPGCIVQ